MSLKQTTWNLTLIARFMGPIWGPYGADRTQVGPMLAHELCYLRYSGMHISIPFSPYCHLLSYLIIQRLLSDFSIKIPIGYIQTPPATFAIIDVISLVANLSSSCIARRKIPLLWTSNEVINETSHRLMGAPCNEEYAVHRLLNWQRKTIVLDKICWLIYT